MLIFLIGSAIPVHIDLLTFPGPSANLDQKKEEEKQREKQKEEGEGSRVHDIRHCSGVSQ